MRESGELLLGRFVRGKVRYVLKDEGDRYASMRREEIQPADLELLKTIEGMGRATTRQLAAATGMDKGALKDAVSRLDRSLLIIRDFDEREDWGTENTTPPTIRRIPAEIPRPSSWPGPSGHTAPYRPAPSGSWWTSRWTS